jgi:hypothetical protein
MNQAKSTVQYASLFRTQVSLLAVSGFRVPAYGNAAQVIALQCCIRAAMHRKRKIPCRQGIQNACVNRGAGRGRFR